MYPFTPQHVASYHQAIDKAIAYHERVSEMSEWYVSRATLEQHVAAAEHCREFRAWLMRWLGCGIRQAD